jgi:uncharacterized membrane protein YdfJ with MMPL/SSD domain
VLGQPSASTLPLGTEPRVALEQLAAGFGPGAVGPVEILVPTAGGASAPADADRIAHLQEGLAADPGIAAVPSIAVPGADPSGLISTDGDMTRVVVVGTDNPQSDDAGRRDSNPTAAAARWSPQPAIPRVDAGRLGGPGVGCW